MTCCTLCAPLHAGVWRVVPRGYKEAPDLTEPWRGENDGEGAE